MPLVDTKRSYWSLLEAHRSLGVSGAEQLTRDLFRKDAELNASHPINRLVGRDSIIDDLWTPLLRSFPDLERRTDILISGSFNGSDWIASTGYFVGSFERDWLGIPATRKPAWLRYGWFDRLVNDKVAESYVIFDIPALMMQARAWPLSPPLGAEILAPAPATHDGVMLHPADHSASAQSLKLVEEMIAGLMQYDGQSLASMGMRRFWPDSFHWYGPAPIGSMRGHADYERGHQGPFLNAFPDRVGGNHKCRIGEGAYVASAGWPSIRATHLGGGWLGLGATGREVTMRVMDFWRREGAMLAENWVFIDIPDLLLQMDVDVFARLAEWQVAR